ncbi:MAG: hypothetical protein ABI042_19900 [Verrucomicrobiota bacterium]
MAKAKQPTQGELREFIRTMRGVKLLGFADWFDAYRTSVGLTPKGYVMEWQESPEQIAEIKRRLQEVDAHPEKLRPLNARFFNNLRKELAAKRRQRAALLRRIEKFEAAQRKAKGKRHG